MVTDETTMNENIREVLKVESMIEGGCKELLDKEQALLRQGNDVRLPGRGWWGNWIEM